MPQITHPNPFHTLIVSEGTLSAPGSKNPEAGCRSNSQEQTFRVDPDVRLSREQQRELRRIAHHEAGHAVVAAAYGLWPSMLTIVRDEASKGKTRFEPPAYPFATDYGLAAWILTALAGIAAEDRYSRDDLA